MSSMSCTPVQRTLRLTQFKCSLSYLCGAGNDAIYLNVRPTDFDNE